MKHATNSSFWDMPLLSFIQNDLGLARMWLKQMGNSAQRYGLTIQWVVQLVLFGIEESMNNQRTTSPYKNRPRCYVKSPMHACPRIVDVYSDKTEMFSVSRNIILQPSLPPSSLPSFFFLSLQDTACHGLGMCFRVWRSQWWHRFESVMTTSQGTPSGGLETPQSLHML